MLIIDRTQRTWATLSAVVCVVAGGAYLAYANWSTNGPSGGSVPGLIFGLIAAAMMVFAGLLAARRRFPAARIGSAQFWMKGHLWIGTLTVPFALFHAGFGLGGRVEILLWILFSAVILSGFWGLFLQQLLPRMMLENMPRETFIEQIPHLCNRFTAASDCQLAEVCGPLEVALTPVDLKRLESYWQPFFEEDRKKNRTEYPKTASDAVHFQKFLTKVYVGLPASANVSTTEAPIATASVAAPAMKSVAQIKGPELVAAHPPATVDGAAVKAKPDPKALLAAAKAKAASAPPVVATSDAPAPESAPAIPAAVTGKPDPRAMLAAAKAKKALETAAPGSDATSEPPAPTTPAVDGGASPAKPDPKALLAAARAKKAAAEAALTPQDATAVPPADIPAEVAPTKPDPKAMLAAAKAKKALEATAAATNAPADAPAEATPNASSEPSSAPAKPDPKAILAAARAKKAAAEAAATAQEPTVAPAAEVAPVAAPAKPDPKAMLAAAKAKKAQEAAAATPADAPVEAAPPTSPETNSTPAKPDPKAMLAAAKAKRDAAAAAGAASSPVVEASAPAVVPPAGEPAPAPTPTGKPDPKAMMAALKAKKEAAAQQGATPAAEAPAAKANPLAQLKAVKQPPADAPPDLVAAAKVAPPTPTQIKELKLFYLELIRPQLPMQPATQSWREAIRRSIMACQIRSDNQHPQFTRIFEYLLDLCEQRRQFAMIERYHFWLHGWLLVHIPVTVALYVVLVVHAVVALRVIPFGN